METRSSREAGVWTQTRSLLYKNMLIKWRTKQQTVQEVILPLLLVGLLILISSINPHVYHAGFSTVALEREVLLSFTTVGYTPISNITTRIMEEAAHLLRSLDADVVLEMFSTEQQLENASLFAPSSFVGVVFQNWTSYQLRFPYNELPLPSDYTESFASCVEDSTNCRAASYWDSGFIRLQSSIDAAIIKMQTGQAVWGALSQMEVLMMGQPAWVDMQTFSHSVTSVYLVLAFTPLVSFLIASIAAEKERRVKDFMRLMGLRDSAFWLSWGLLYAALVTILALLMSAIATCTALFPNSHFILIFLIIFLYGISSILYSFMVTPLFQKPKLASTVGSLLTVVLGCLSLLTVLIRDFPQPLVWVLCLLSPAAFSIAIAQVVYLEAHGSGAVFSALSSGPHPLHTPLLMLLLDSVLYLLLALYLDQVLPGEFGSRRPFLYFLKPSYWSRGSRQYTEASDGQLSGPPLPPDSAHPIHPIEPVSPEFRGREAIRISNLRKVYNEKHTPVEALRGISFDIYEGQITALLGHSGAGKSTLINILCGISAPSDGRASVYGWQLCEGVEVRQLVGICPQFNVQFDVLTVEEHLRVFAAIKAVPAAEVVKVMTELDLERIKDAPAKKLSGGQKRKLCLAIALLGDPKVLLLDEPTAGMDPSSRHQVWSVLRGRRAGRVTVICTHYMDEADILADRKAVMSHGQLKCVGSSLYLKTKCGLGYHLRMVMAEGSPVDCITALVKQHVSKAQLSRQQEAELTYTLPFESMDRFSGLFSELDSRPDLGISNYGVSMTTLEEVFLRLEAESEVDQADYSVFDQSHRDQEAEASSLDEIDEQLLSFSEGRDEVVTGPALWRQQCGAVARLHVLNLWRENLLIYVLAMFGAFLVSVLILSVVSGNIQFQATERQLLPLYLLGSSRPAQRYSTALLVQNATDGEISEFLRGVASQDIVVELQKDPDYMVLAPHSAAIVLEGSSQDLRYQVAFNSTAVHSLPMVVNILTNALLRYYNGTASILTCSKPFQFRMTDSMLRALIYIEAVLLGMLASGTPSYFAMEHTRDCEMKCRSTLRVSGLVPSAYWCGRGLVDVPLFYLLLFCMVSTLFLFHATYLTQAIAIFPAILCVIGSGPAMVLFTYAVSFMFTRVQSNRDFLSVTLMMVCVASASLVQLAFINHSVDLAEILHCIFCTICPFYPLIGCLHYISKAAFLSSGDDSDEFLRKGLVIAVVVPYLQCLLLLFLLHCLEVRYGGRAMRNDTLCRIGPRAAGGSRVQRSPGDYGAEDEDVQMERARVKEALTCQSCEEKPVLLVSDLRKEYTGGNEGGASSQRKKVAANNISFSVRKGEVLGLLGPNSSGKSTVIHLLAGDMEPTAGQVLIGGDSVAFGRGPPAMQHLGYCPQVSPLWPKVTLLEHLQIYAAIKGLHPRAVPDIVTRVVNALELKDHLHKRAVSLSAGIKRKLCFALSMLGNPQAVLLDEPSTGMDPKSKQRMWRALHAAFKSSQRGAVLSTHYMEEAEAVCDRVAILVSGRLRCIGSIQQLKGKYGRGYSLELKLREEDAERLQQGAERLLQGAELLHREILQIFPHAVRQESFESLMVYKVPVGDVESLAEAFSQLERVKQKFHFEEYHFSQSTLEQVFLEFAKQQESEEEEGAGPLSTSFRWQRLHQDWPDDQSESTVQQL